ncbi:c-type cytochrome [Falsiroseomonas sp. HW251]|uniref:c-type cytochrome n=1 Tax=Falsiroseomonas sp. HW251 TaxID=3390998 RepID=UPI003D30F15F
MRFILGVTATLVVLAVGGFIVVFTGAFDVAATTPHWPPTISVLDAAMRRSVQRQAQAVVPAGALTEEQARRGYRHYSEACVYCHGAPGRDPADWSGGLYPEPPYMPDVPKLWSDAQIFWIVRHGIKMSAMPAFGAHLSDAEIWDIVALVRRMGDMTPEAYAAYGNPPAGAPAPR